MCGAYTGEWPEDCRWVLSYHGRQKHAAQWVVETYSDRDDYVNDEGTQRWITASKQVIAEESE